MSSVSGETSTDKILRKVCSMQSGRLFGAKKVLARSKVGACLIKSDFVTIKTII